MIAARFPAPYYAVIFTSLRTAQGAHDYEVAAHRMVELASEQPGFLGVESARGEDGLGITVSYWTDEQAILGWKQHIVPVCESRDVRTGIRPVPPESARSSGTMPLRPRHTETMIQPFGPV